MEDGVNKILSIIIIIICFLLVTFVYIYNYHFKRTLLKSSTPQQLCQLLYQDRVKPPEAFTYDKQTDGKYVIYRLDYSDFSYKRSLEDLPVDVDNFIWFSKNKGELDVTVTKTGFKINELEMEFNCPSRWSWSSEEGQCIEDPLCSKYDNSIMPLLNAEYSEIDNPAVTIHTAMTGNHIHQKLYIECSKADKKPVVKSCSENTFIKISQEPYDESKLSPILPLENGEPNVNAICKRFDVCEDRKDYSMHRFLVNDSDEPLEMDEYYVCKNNKSEKKKCGPNHKINPDIEHAASHICIPINRCDVGHDFYFRINNDSYGYCRHHVEYLVSCDGKGIFDMPDLSIECRNQQCLEPNKVTVYNNHFFNYPYGIESCFEGNSPKKISCDNMFKELQPTAMISNVALPRTKINRPLESSKNAKEYFEDYEIVLPTKFYYDTNTEQCEPFKPDNIKQFLINNKMINDNAVINKSTSHGMRSLPFRLKDDVMMLNPADFGFKDAKQVYAIFNGKIYSTGALNEGTLWNSKSLDFYSFISPIDVEPERIGNEITVLDSINDEIDGVHYGLCIKYHKKLTISDNIGNPITVLRLSLTEFENDTDHSTIPPASVEKYQINYRKLVLDKVLPQEFPIDQFLWNKLFVGKYFYDVEKNRFIIWHDHLFVISVLKRKLVVSNTTDENGQLIIDHPPTVIYNDKNEKISTWDKTALVTTFDYFGGYFNSLAPFWVSFIGIPVEKLNKKDVLNYLHIDYPKLQEDIMPKTLMSIIKMEPIDLSIGFLSS